MDELEIDEKKYLSSKRAAKVTGYAKDYVGQLCREGRVQARLVGRSWYVLESSIHDHRFGKDTNTGNKSDDALEASSSQTWEPLKYAASVDTGVLPVTKIEVETYVEQKILQPEIRLQQEEVNTAWDSWFNMVSESASDVLDLSRAESEVSARRPVQAEETYEKVETYQPDEPVEPIKLERINSAISSKASRIKPDRRNRQYSRAVVAISGVIVIVSAVIVLANSGYVDQYIVSYRQASIITGILELKK